MLALAKYSIGVGDRFAHQAKAQLRACLLAAEKGVEVIPVWNKSNREHTIIGSDGWSAQDQITLMDMVAAGTLQPVIHSIRPFQETAEAMQELIDRRVFGKSVLTV